MQIELKKAIIKSYVKGNNLIKAILIFWFLLVFTGSSSFNDGNTQTVNFNTKNNVKVNKFNYTNKKTDSLKLEKVRLVNKIKKTLDTIKQQQKELKNEKLIKRN